MPIREVERARYPENWRQISRTVKERADWLCECRGECGWSRHVEWIEEAPDVEPRCPAHHGEESPLSGSMVVLTVAHLDHQPENVTDENLRASYDRDHHAETRRATREAAQR